MTLEEGLAMEMELMAEGDIFLAGRRSCTGDAWTHVGGRMHCNNLKDVLSRYTIGYNVLRFMNALM